LCNSLWIAGTCVAVLSPDASARSGAEHPAGLEKTAAADFIFRGRCASN